MLDRSDERRNRRAAAGPILPRTTAAHGAHIFVRTVQDFQERRHGRATDPDQRFLYRAIVAKRAGASEMLTPALEESGVAWGGHPSGEESESRRKSTGIEGPVGNRQHPPFWTRKAGALGGGQAMIEHWQLRREGGKRRIVEIVPEGT